MKKGSDSIVTAKEEMRPLANIDWLKLVLNEMISVHVKKFGDADGTFEWYNRICQGMTDEEKELLPVLIKQRNEKTRRSRTNKRAGKALGSSRRRNVKM